MQEKELARYAWMLVKEGIKDDIDEGRYKPGHRIPSVARLATKYSVSVSTVRQAMDELAWDGVVNVHQGRGTVVAEPKLLYNPLMGFAEQARQLGGEPRTNVQETGWVNPHRDTLHWLSLRKGGQVWQARRIHHLDDLPVIVEFTEMKRPLGLKFMDDLKKLQSIFRTLREDLGYSNLEVEVASVDTTSDRFFSELLGIPRRTTFYELERRISIEGKPQLVSYLVLRSDRFKVRFAGERPTNRTEGKNEASAAGRKRESA
jgi:DNA-binding GntR family transcriptional regulator